MMPLAEKLADTRGYGSYSIVELWSDIHGEWAVGMGDMLACQGAKRE
jgi:hypothetical protein